jgi:hypothetical protein
MVPVNLNKRLKSLDGKAGGSGDVWVFAAMAAKGELGHRSFFQRTSTPLDISQPPGTKRGAEVLALERIRPT